MYKKFPLFSKSKQATLIPPELAGSATGVALIAAGALAHSVDMIYRRKKIEEAQKKLEQIIKDNPVSIDSVKLPKGVTFSRNSKELRKWVESHSDPMISKYMSTDVAQQQRKNYIDHLYKEIEPSYGSFIGKRDMWGATGEGGHFIKPHVHINELRLNKGTGGQILAHELGHYDQYKEGDLEKRYLLKNRIHNYFSSLVDPKQDTDYKKEEDAWSRAGYVNHDPIRQAALETYLHSARLNRTLGLRLGTVLVGNALILKDVYKHL